MRFFYKKRCLIITFRGNCLSCGIYEYQKNSVVLRTYEEYLLGDNEMFFGILYNTTQIKKKITDFLKTVKVDYVAYTVESYIESHNFQSHFPLIQCVILSVSLHLCLIAIFSIADFVHHENYLNDITNTIIIDAVNVSRSKVENAQSVLSFSLGSAFFLKEYI